MRGDWAEEGEVCEQMGGKGGWGGGRGRLAPPLGVETGRRKGREKQGGRGGKREEEEGKGRKGRETAGWAGEGHTHTHTHTLRHFPALPPRNGMKRRVGREKGREKGHLGG